ncbi:MAG TPA: MBL fold metallo-hydrolase [Miltoncostaeaceae bacterium]|nr:MBL fold metallo-hydrolase [Miltoncostaeaceae bacterium]
MILRGGTFGPVATNTYVVADDRGGSAWIVDPAMGSRAWVEETLRRLDVTPLAVLDTHGHWDHVVENHVWADAGLPVWVGAGDEDWVEAPAPFNPELFGHPPPTPGVTPARILQDGEVLELGDMRVRLIAAPGHSPGCMVALVDGDEDALVGDVVFAQGIGRTDFPRSDHAAMMRSLDRIFAEVPRETRIHPGHGPWGVTLGEAEPYARMFM